MINSMTGFGRGYATSDGRSFTVELKSVNHKFLDLGSRLPRSLVFLDDVFRDVIKQRIARGHIDIYITYENTRDDAKTITVDTALAEKYVQAAKQIASCCGINNDMSASRVLNMSEVTSVTDTPEDPECVKALAVDATNAAIDELLIMRGREGENIAADLRIKLTAISEIRAAMLERAPLVAQNYAAKLNERIAQILSETEVDRARLATEIALFADRASIDEELVRISSHVTEFLKMLDASEPTGRKMDFLTQELNREFNTIGSKASDAELQKLVISGKAEVEKLREQVQNIE